MATDANILMGIKPMQTKDPMELYEAGQRIEQNRLAGLMNTMKMDEYQRGVTDQNTLRDVYKKFGTDSAANTSALYGAGLGKQAGEYAKSQGDLSNQAATTSKTQLEAAGKKLDMAGSAFGYVRSNPTVENAHAALDYLGQNGVYNPEQVAQYKQKVLSDPSKVGEMADTAFRASLSAKDQLFKTETRNTGGTTDTLAIDPVTGKTQASNSVRNTQSPDSVASNATLRANNAATVGATYAGQQLTDERARDANSIASQGNVIKTETDLRKEFADLPEVKRYKAAYPSFKAIQDAAKSNNPQADINLIYGLAKLYDPESVVREGEYATIANSQAIPERVKSIAQSLSGGGKLAPETKRQILEQAGNRIATFEGEYGKAKDAYGGIATGRGARTENVIPKVGEPLPPQVVKVTSDADYAKVPSGATYTAPDGKTRVKK